MSDVLNPKSEIRDGPHPATAGVRVKICGITSLPDALTAAAAGADALGFVFFERSPRFVRPALAAEIISQLPPGVVRVGVFVNAPEEEVRRTATECGLDVLQLHGEEPPELCARLGLGSEGDVLRRRQGPGAVWNVVKAFQVRDASCLDGLGAYACGAWLLDSFVPGQPGGTGATFNWDLAVAAKRAGRPIILAGGLTPENVAAAVRRVRPYGVDVSSGVEATPGRKDPAKVRAFVRAAREAG